MHLFCGKLLKKAAQASEALGLTADKLQSLGIVEYVVDEGEGAHLDPEQVMQKPKSSFEASFG